MFDIFNSLQLISHAEIVWTLANGTPFATTLVSLILALKVNEHAVHFLPQSWNQLFIFLRELGSFKGK